MLEMDHVLRRIGLIFRDVWGLSVVMFTCTLITQTDKIKATL